ncbi:hypothetical protein DFH08DRAFT_875060 [Mycena albidolilacea]|uniref:STAS domain-containing protein n=1 Tax=Mycena albidolilacea TaxID=1033008 RepID=A0AAD6ZUW4_9AGAR|nr:hypothetical protein DFH08DRAFT_875060 [Mycena albidolilacea]
MSMYLMSTIASQLTMTFGGSRFSGALGSMLIEILPFLRAIATSIRLNLGDDHPGLLPTVMAAYAMTSFLTGACFIVLGALRCGRLVEYFPRTVLTGAIGAIGVSLFILGLGLTFPPLSDPLTLSSGGRLLFAHNHVGLLFASFLPAFFLSISTRSTVLGRWTRGATQHALYVPVYVLGVAGVFWAVVAGTGQANAAGMADLASQGWLFTVEASIEEQHGIGEAWIYWRLFDFSKTEWHAMKDATLNIVLLVVIGVFNLPIYVPALALALDIPSYSMDHELLGHGASNILAGMLGTLPNLVVFSNALFFTRAGGGRFEAMVVIILTFVLFLVSSLLLPFVPTLLASALVLFLGIELTSEAVWESAKTLLWCEWAVVMGTLFACSFLGFAQGFGVGVGIAVVVHVGWGTLDSRARSVEIPTFERQHGILPNQRHPLSRSFHLTADSKYDTSTNGPGDLEKNDSNSNASMEEKSSGLRTSTRPTAIRIVHLTGYAFFATIPSLERQLKAPSPSTHVILDLTRVHRLETAVADFVGRKSRELMTTGTLLVLCGFNVSSGVAADLVRGGIDLLWPGRPHTDDAIAVFEELREALAWCETEAGLVPSPISASAEVDVSDAQILQEFGTLFDDPAAVWDTLPVRTLPEFTRNTLSDVADINSLMVGRYKPGETLISRDEQVQSVVFIVRGRVLFQEEVAMPDPVAERYSFRRDVVSILWRAANLIKTMVGLGRGEIHAEGGVLTSRAVRVLLPGESVGLAEALALNPTNWTSSDRVAVATTGPCYTVEVRRSCVGEDKWSGMCNWAAKIGVQLEAQQAQKTRRLDRSTW